jgi:hypothetical protein
MNLLLPIVLLMMLSATSLSVDNKTEHAIVVDTLDIAPVDGLNILLTTTKLNRTTHWDSHNYIV